MGRNSSYCTLFGVLIIRILLFGVLFWGPLFSETATREQQDSGSLRLTRMADKDPEAWTVFCRSVYGFRVCGYWGFGVLGFRDLGGGLGGLGGLVDLGFRV